MGYGIEFTRVLYHVMVIHIYIYMFVLCELIIYIIILVSMDALLEDYFLL